MHLVSLFSDWLASVAVQPIVTREILCVCVFFSLLLH